MDRIGRNMNGNASFFQFCIVRPILHAASEHIQVMVLFLDFWFS